MFNDEGIIIFLKENHPDMYDEIEKSMIHIRFGLEFWNKKFRLWA